MNIVILLKIFEGYNACMDCSKGMLSSRNGGFID